MPLPIQIRPHPLRATTGALSVVVFVCVTGCAVPLQHLPTEEGADFTAHLESRGLVVDRSTDGQQALVAPGSALPFSSGPDLVIESNGRRVAALWERDVDHIAVRDSQNETAPVVGRVEATWKDGVLRLQMQSAEGGTWTTSRFHRIDGRIAWQALGLYEQMPFDVEGTYRADVRDAAGRRVGWLRLEINSSGQPLRLYEGDLPLALDADVATAAVALLDADVNDIESHIVDVHRGD